MDYCLSTEIVHGEHVAFLMADCIRGCRLLSEPRLPGYRYLVFHPSEATSRKLIFSGMCRSLGGGRPLQGNGGDGFGKGVGFRCWRHLVAPGYFCGSGVALQERSEEMGVAVLLPVRAVARQAEGYAQQFPGIVIPYAALEVENTGLFFCRNRIWCGYSRADYF